MIFLLGRHGNTFKSGDPVVWAGATNDLPLVESGILQAKSLAKALFQQEIKPAGVYCSALQRTYHYAQIICSDLKLNLKPQVDPRLHELDYGGWTGLTHEQVVSQFGSDTLNLWEEKSLWPSNANWQGSPAAVITEVKNLVSDLISKHNPNDTLLLISSNGRLRYFLSLVEREFDNRIREQTFKIKTGHLGKLIYEKNHFNLSYWNKNPAFLTI